MIEPPVVIWLPPGGPASVATGRSIAKTVASDVQILAGTPGSEALAAAAATAGRPDLVVVSPGVQVFGDWLPRLVAAAHADSTIATASALLSAGRWAPEPLTQDILGAAASSVAEHARRLRPRVSEPQAGCVLLRRTALEIAGSGTDAPFARWLAEFGERCGAVGLSHVIADDVLAGGAPAQGLLPDDVVELDARWSHRRAARELDAQPESPIGHALLVASRGLDKLSVTIDGRALGPLHAGTQIHAIELIAALGRSRAVALRIVTPPDLDGAARALLEEIEDLELLPYETAAQQPARPTDIVHRASQVFSVDDLNLLLPLGRRLVVTHQDLIAYRIAGYHDAVDNWLRYRSVTRDVLSAADRVVFFSEHARADALADNLVDSASATVVPIGVDHQVLAQAGPPRRPDRLGDDDAPFLLCLGADLRHKNHGFAVKLLAALRVHHGWQGRLVIAGPAASCGSAPLAAGEEPVVALGPVAEEEKAWLLQHAAAVVYATLYEGFGLVPFEAASAGTACLFAAQASLAEVLPWRTATLVPWDPAASASASAPLLAPGPARSAHVDALRAAGVRYRWDETAVTLLRVYDEVLVAPPREARRAPRERLALQERLEQNEQLRALEWQRQLAFREQIGSDGLGLVGPGGVLDAEDQRALLALMSRRPLRRPLLRAARSAYALAMRLRRRNPKPDQRATR
jgi:glycosyltransferase involved in cell wall biosynthesis